MMRGSPGEGTQKEPGPPRRPGQCGRASLEWLSPWGTLEGRVTQALSVFASVAVIWVFCHSQQDLS